MPSNAQDRLFAPLNTEHYRNFRDHGKEWELRGVNAQFNPETVRTGRPAELRRGYSTPDSLWGIITDRLMFDSLAVIPDWIDHELILPDSTVEEFLASARALLGEYSRYIAFRVDVDGADG